MSDQAAIWPASPASSPLVEEAMKWVSRIAAEHQTASFLYHHYQRTTGLLQLIEELAIGNRCEEEQWEIAALALLFLDAGRWIDPAQPLSGARQQAQAFCRKHPCPDNTSTGLLMCLQVLHRQHPGPQKAAQLALDTLTAYDFGLHFSSYRKLASLEQQLLTPQAEPEDNEALLRRLATLKLQTPYARQKYSTLLAENLADLYRERQSDSLSGKEIADMKFARLEKKVPRRGLQTFFRTNYRSHLNLSAIADNKANIMISINTILVSVLISLLTYKNITETQPMVLMPVIIFLITGLTSLIFAILSIRPKVTTLIHRELPEEERVRNLIFFGNFVRLDLDAYEEAMDRMLRSSHLLYGNMVRDLYHLGKVLDKKYRMLTISYNIFMIGFAATVLSFLFVLLF